MKLTLAFLWPVHFTPALASAACATRLAGDRRLRRPPSALRPREVRLRVTPLPALRPRWSRCCAEGVLAFLAAPGAVPSTNESPPPGGMSPKTARSLGAAPPRPSSMDDSTSLPAWAGASRPPSRRLAATRFSMEVAASRLFGGIGSSRRGLERDLRRRAVAGEPAAPPRRTSLKSNGRCLLASSSSTSCSSFPTRLPRWPCRRGRTGLSADINVERCFRERGPALRYCADDVKPAAMNTG